MPLFVRWDVLKGGLQGPSLTQGRHSEGRSPFSVEDLPDQSLYLADWGFFGVERWATMARRGESKRKRRYFITRWQPGTALSTRTGHRINLHGILPMQVGQRVELGALRGVQQRLPVRVLIERVPKEVAQERQERIREAAQAHGRQAREEICYLANRPDQCATTHVGF